MGSTAGQRVDGTPPECPKGTRIFGLASRRDAAVAWPKKIFAATLSERSAGSRSK